MNTNNIFDIVLQFNVDLFKKYFFWFHSILKKENKYLWKLIYVRDFKNNHIIKSYDNTYAFYYQFKKIKRIFQQLNINSTTFTTSYGKKLLSNNNLSFIFQLINLNKLYIYNSDIITFPSEIGLLTNLYSLCISHNQLTILPTEIGLLKKLQRLNISRNKISILPSEIGLLSELKKLNVCHNNLNSYEKELKALGKLKKLFICDNPMISCNNISYKLVNIDKIITYDYYFVKTFNVMRAMAGYDRLKYTC